MEIEELILHRKQTSHSEDTELIETIEETAFSLLEKGNWKKALELTEKATHINGPVKGQNDPKTEEFVSIMLKKICGIAIERIEKNDAASALTLLERLETITLKFHSSQLTVDKCEIFNNIACAYRKINKLHTAKRYLEKALLLTMNDHEDRIDKSTTYLNMCAVLSNLNKHSQAIRYARQAMQFAQEELLNAKLDEKQEVMNHKIAVLGIAYNNLGVEEEFLGNKLNAIEWYRKAVNFMMKNSNTQQEHLLENFRQCYEEAIKKGEGKKVAKLKRPMSAIINKQSQLSISSKSNNSKVNSKPSGNKRKYESTPMSPSLEGGFNTRYPLEGKPITFDDIRVKTRKIASAKPKMPYKFYAGSEDSDTEEDIKDLDDLGLLSDLEESEKIDKTSNKRVAWSATKDRPPIHPNINSKPIFSIRSIASARRQPKNLSSTDSKKSSTSKLLPLEIMETPNKGTEIVSQPIFHFIDYNDPKTLIMPTKKEEIKVEPKPKIDEVSEPARSKAQTPEIVTIIKEEEKKVEKPMPEIKLTKNEERKPSKNLIEKIEKNVTKKKNEIDMSKALPLIIKIQARVRAMQAREKFKLMKNRPNVVYRAVKFINQQEFKIIVSKMGSKTYVTAYNGENTYKMETNSDIDPKDVLNLLNFDSKKGLNLKPVSVEEDKKILVRTRIINLAGEECEVKYFTDPDVDTLQIKLRKLSNNRIYTYFIKNLALHSQSLLIQQINEVIQPNLAIIDQYLTVLGAENLIANPKVLESPHVFQKPEPKPVISAYHGKENSRKNSASSSYEPNLEESSKNTSQISNSSNSQSIERATAGLSIKIIESKGPAVPIEPDGQNDSSSLESNPAQKLKFILENNKSQLKSMKNPFQTETVKNIPKLSKAPEEVKPQRPATTAENPKSKKYTQKEVRAVILIQKVFRGHRIRDKLKFENPKHSLLAQSKKRLGKNKYMISIYKLSDGVLIDVQNVSGNERYWKAIRNPKEYVNNFNRFSDIRLLMNRLVDIEGKVAILRAHTSKTQIRMQDCSFFGEGTQQDIFISPRDMSNWPIYLRKTINGKEYAIQADINNQRGLDTSLIPLFSGGKTISKTFSEVDIIEELGVNEPKQLIDLLTLRNGKIEIKRKEFSQANSPKKLSSLSAETGKYPLLYQTCRFYDSKNYQIKIILVYKNPGRLSNDDVLFVNIKTVAAKENVAKLPIEAGKACALTGLSLRSLDLVAVKISKHIIYDNGKFSIDFTAKKRDPIQSLITIQALVRGFLTRRLLRNKKLPSIRSTEESKNASSKLKNLDLSSLSIDSEDSETEKENSFVRNFGGKNWYWRASRQISNEECIITIYESKDKMGIEAVVCSTSKRLILTVEKSVVNDIDQFVSHLELSPDKKRLLHNLEKAAKVIYSDTRFISNKLGNLEIYVTEKGYFASFFLIKEGKSLTLFLGENVSPDESVRKLRIEDKTGQDILVISS